MDIEALKKRRASAKGKMTRIQTFLETASAQPAEAVSVRMAGLESAWKEYDDIHNQIIAALSKDSDIEQQEREYVEMETRYYNLMVGLKKMINGSSSSSASQEQASSADVKLPRITLPVFSGDPLKWPSYHDLFTSVIHNNSSISNAQKLHYLKNSLTGDAANLILSIEVTDANYFIAWNLLLERFQNERILIQHNLKALFGQKSLIGESASGLRNLIDSTVKHVRALKALGLNTESWEPVLVFLVAERLDPDSRRQWELSSPGKEYPSFDSLKEFLEQRSRALEASTKSQLKVVQQGSNSKVPKPVQKSAFYSSSDQPNNSCIFCKDNHSIYRCAKFVNLSDKDKADVARQNRLCFNCLRHGHSSKQCGSNSTCRKCGSKHHTLLHYDRPTSAPLAQQTGSLEATGNSVTSHFSKQSNSNSSHKVMLSTAVINVKDSYGKYQACRALLDSGSQASFVTEACIQRLGLKRSRVEVSIIGIGQSGIGHSRGMVSLEMGSKTSDFNMCISALILEKLTNVIPSSEIHVQHWAHVSNLQLADPTFYRPGKVDIILGADVFSELLIDGRLSGSIGQPSAFNTHLGWVLSGKFAAAESPHSTVSVHIVNTIEIQEQLRTFWELEEVVTKRHLTDAEAECEAHFLANYTRDLTGRFTVSLPVKANQKCLGRSKDMAIKRFESMERKLDKHPQYKDEYHAFMNQYLESKHMEIIPHSERSEIVGKTNYLPHHFVLKETSSTTKLRVVFDASARTSNGVSLNETLLVGPTIQDDIWNILMRFRLHAVAFTADIAKMYRQIKVPKSDADLQRIVWRASPFEPLEEYRLMTVTYGTASAPFQATKVLQQLACEEGIYFPLAKVAALRDFYIDDLMSGANNVENGLEIQTQLISMLERGGFQLRKWSSNESALLDSLPEEFRETKLPLAIDQTEAIKALGLHWQPSGDYFFFIVTLSSDPGKISKRTILSDISKLFDPLGWLAPVILTAKILIQSLWISGVSWDESPPNPIQNDWVQFREQLFTLEQLRIPRYVQYGKHSELQLHGFCDASETGYGAVVYLRTESAEGIINVHLLCAKTKVSPIKRISLPRLELCGALLLARLLHRVQNALHIELDLCQAWTDSTITLAWIVGHPNRWKTFVANRVSEIQDLISPEQWFHVSTKENPADAASRGILPIDIQNHSLWWSGPHWLSQRKEEWPNQTATSKTEDLVVVEEKITTMTAQLSELDWHLTFKFSSLTKLKRVTAYCLRFCNNARSGHERLTGPLSTQELQQALQLCVKSVQGHEFAVILSSIKNGGAIPAQVQSLNPFVDKAGVLRVGGRIRHSNLTYDQRFPILLPQKHELTELVVRDVHLRQLHAGPQATLGILQQQFWIVNGRNVVRRILHKCVVCFRDRATNVDQLMGDLPTHRLEPTRPFLRSGVDFGGPLLIKSTKGRGGKIYKAYFALFVCFSTKAIHLEVVSDLSSAAFIAALKRFIARRGICSDIFSDNGTNFIGANNELRELRRLYNTQQHNNVVSNFLSTKGINWHFNPAKAPHFGGLWEAGIKSAKTHLRRVVGETTLTFEELCTVLAEIEACLNSRPLVSLSSDPNDLTTLTPAHFLVGEPLSAIPEPDLTHLSTNRLSRWQLLQRIKQHFWNRWHKEYLSQLQQRKKWKGVTKNINIGDLVLVKEDNLPPLKWITGRIVNVHPGKDGHIRVVTLKTAKGVYKRPIVKLCVLPV